MPGKRDKAHGKLYKSYVIPIISKLNIDDYDSLNPISTYVKNVEIPNMNNITNNNYIKYGNWLPTITAIGKRKLKHRSLEEGGK